MRTTGILHPGQSAEKAWVQWFVPSIIEPVSRKDGDEKSPDGAVILTQANFTVHWSDFGFRQYGRSSRNPTATCAWYTPKRIHKDERRWCSHFAATAEKYLNSCKHRLSQNKKPLGVKLLPQITSYLRGTMSIPLKNTLSTVCNKSKNILKC